MEHSKISKIGLVILGLAGLGLSTIVLPQTIGTAGLGHATNSIFAQGAPQVGNIPAVQVH